MARFSGKDTRPEMLVRKALHRHGRRFRVGRKDLAGKPDIVLPRLQTAVFVHGCFWHHHEGCKEARLPASNPDFWREKFRLNKDRDQRVQNALKMAGWRVVVIWECEVKKDKIDEILRSHNLID